MIKLILKHHLREFFASGRYQLASVEFDSGGNAEIGIRDVLEGGRVDFAGRYSGMECLTVIIGGQSTDTDADIAITLSHEIREFLAAGRYQLASVDFDESGVGSVGIRDVWEDGRIDSAARYSGMELLCVCIDEASADGDVCVQRQRMRM